MNNALPNKRPNRSDTLIGDRQITRKIQSVKRTHNFFTNQAPKKHPKFQALLFPGTWVTYPVNNTKQTLKTAFSTQNLKTAQLR
jgi:hypothetical protein